MSRTEEATQRHVCMEYQSTVKPCIPSRAHVLGLKASNRLRDSQWAHFCTRLGCEMALCCGKAQMAREKEAALLQTMTFIPAAQLKIQKSATSHEFSKQGVLLTFSGSKKLYCCWIGEAMMWPLFPAGPSIQQRSRHSSNRNSSKTKCFLHALHFS